MLTTLVNKVRTWFGKESLPGLCLQCDLPPGRQLMVPSEEPLVHPHLCSRCGGVLYVPGPMFSCDRCSERGGRQRAA